MRAFVIALLVAVCAAPAAADDALWALLRAGRAGRADPPCGHRSRRRRSAGIQARRLPHAAQPVRRGAARGATAGASFRERNVPVARVLASPWCRTLETARIAFGVDAQKEPALANLFEYGQNRERQVAAFRTLVAARAEAGQPRPRHARLDDARVHRHQPRDRGDGDRHAGRRRRLPRRRAHSRRRRDRRPARYASPSCARPPSGKRTITTSPVPASGSAERHRGADALPQCAARSTSRGRSLFSRCPTGGRNARRAGQAPPPARPGPSSATRSSTPSACRATVTRTVTPAVP